MDLRDASASKNTPLMTHQRQVECTGKDNQFTMTEIMATNFEKSDIIVSE